MSNKTPKVSAKKTKSALKPSLLILLVLGLAVFTFWLVLQFVRTLNREVPPSSQVTDMLCLKLQAEDSECSTLLYVADTQEEQTKGLSGRSSLPEDRGMAFIFDTPGQQCFWMKDTLIPLDMIWLDGARRVTKIEATVQPSSYPTSFCSAKPFDQYVIELNAGKAEQLGIKVGQSLSF